MRKLLVGVAACAAMVFGGAASLPAAPTWAPAATAPIHPGVQTVTAGAQCTANFIFADATNVYIGQAAHCAGTGGNTETDGCTAGSLPLGTPVTIRGASHPGTLIYSSWLQMQADHETDPNACAYNDIGIVRIDPADVSKVNPSIPFWGGPVGLDTNATQRGEKVYSYGNSSLRLGLTQLSPKQGISTGSTANWTNSVYTVSPGIPGDSGSAFLNANGDALGVLSTLVIAPLPASNNVSELSSMLDYMRAHTTLDAIQLVPGTQPFTPNRLL